VILQAVAGQPVMLDKLGFDVLERAWNALRKAGYAAVLFAMNGLPGLQNVLKDKTLSMLQVLWDLLEVAPHREGEANAPREAAPALGPVIPTFEAFSSQTPSTRVYRGVAYPADHSSPPAPKLVEHVTAGSLRRIPAHDPAPANESVVLHYRQRSTTKRAKIWPPRLQSR